MNYIVTSCIKTDTLIQARSVSEAKQKFAKMLTFDNYTDMVNQLGKELAWVDIVCIDKF